MIFAGIDIGSRSAKAAVINNNTIISSVIGDTGPESVKTSHQIMEVALKGTGLSLNDIKYIVPFKTILFIIFFGKNNTN